MTARQRLHALFLLASICPLWISASPAIQQLTWTYSTDGGKTFVADPTATAGRVRAQATFTVADPAALGGLHLSLPGKTGAFTRGNTSAWRCPVLLETSLQLNGKAAGYLPSPWILYDRVDLDPAALRIGANTLFVEGTYTLAEWSGHDPAHHHDPLALALNGLTPDQIRFQAGPVVGAIENDYVGICARTNGAGATVTLIGRTDQGAAVTLTSQPGLFHRFRVHIPPTTRSLTYSLTAAVGGRPTAASAGPFTVRLPDLTQNRLRFAVVGDTDGGAWKDVAAKIQAANADFLVHAGGMNYFPILNDGWTGIFENAAALHATLPTYAVRGFRDDGSLEFDNLFYRPASNGMGEHWTQAIGPLRLIGMGLEDWQTGSPNIMWLEKILAAAKEPFVFVVFHPAAYSSDESCRPPLAGHLLLSRTVVAPLLAKYHVTAMISANSHGYERSEPTADLGVTQLVAGACGGTTRPRPSGRAGSNNPFLKVYQGTTHYLLFDIIDSQCTMKTLSLAGAELDHVTFDARQ